MGLPIVRFDETGQRATGFNQNSFRKFETQFGGVVMKILNTGFGVTHRKLVILVVVITLGFSLTPTYRAEADWSGSSFLGGMAAGHIMSRIGANMRARTRAEEYAAYARPRYPEAHVVYHQAPVAAPTPAAAPAQAAPMTPEQKLQQLDKLAAGGYITPAEYKARRKAILDSM
jgi:hypothetical protein